MSVDLKANPSWERMWENLEPGTAFDALSPSPALLKYIQDGKVPRGRALVPGCGRGYDVNALAKNGDRDVLGIDIVEKAVSEAKSWYESLPSDQKAPSNNVKFEKISFFELSTKPSDQFDFIYDYTFLCALDPSIRIDWAKQMADLVKKDGILMTLIFPIRPIDDFGPPYAVSLNTLKNLLIPQGFECLELDMLPPELCHPGRDGIGLRGWKSGIGLWKKIE